MPIIEARGSLSSQGYGQFARQAAGGAFIEDVFSTWLYTGNGTSQSIPNGIRLGNGATSPGWIATLGGSGSDIGNSIAVDSSGNIYICGQSNASGTDDFQIAKYNTSGIIQWQRRLGGSTQSIGYSIAVDSSGNVYVCGQSEVAGNIDFQIAKYNTSGSIQWQRRLGGSGLDAAYSIAVDSSGNVYVGGISLDPGTYDFQIAKYNTSGAIQWQRRLGGSGTESCRSVAVDSSGNVYVSGISNDSGILDSQIAKYNTSGTIQWQRRLGGSSSTEGNSVAVDSSGNVYVSGTSNTSGTIDIQLAKYNTSGVIQWQRRLGGGAGNNQGLSIAVDSSGNVYVSGRSDASGTTDFQIAKYNTSGTIQWQRRLGGAGVNLGNSVAVDSSGNVYVCGRSTAPGTSDFLFAKLPGDGSGTGAYNVGGYSYTYAPSTLTDAATSLTDAATSLTDAATSLTDAATSLTDAATTLNSSTTPLAEGAGLGGLVWMKGRSGATDHALYDTVRGATFDLASNTTAAQTTQAQGLTAFLGSGFSIGSLAKLNTSSATYASWTFAKQPKFFDVVTYTGTGASSQIVNHILGVPPSCIIAKVTSASGDQWRVYTRVNDTTWTGLRLNTTGAGSNFSYSAISPALTSTTIDVGFISTNIEGNQNVNGTSYVMYLFAHNAGGFGASGTDNAISCGSAAAAGLTTVNLGYEPQWVLIKSATVPNSWYVFDNMRGLTANSGPQTLNPNTAAAEYTESADTCNLTSTGFTFNSARFNGDATYIYIAIRRGPMRTPTSGTSVYLPDAGTNGTSGGIVPIGFPVDLALTGYRSLGAVAIANDRLRGFGTSNSAGVTPALETSTTGSESAYSGSNPWFYNAWNTTITRGSNGANPGGAGIITWFMRRAPGFFDVVCYTGTGVARTVTHNLGVVPELMIVKRRSSPNEAWSIYPSDPTKYLEFSTSGAAATSITWNNTAPTSSVFSIGTAEQVNLSGSTNVAYLFASCPGVSKVGAYTGTGSTLQVDCGFTSGARFVLIKRTDATGDWYVWDSARGIVPGDDPYLRLNSSAAEVTNTDWVDTLAAGFEVSNAGSNLVNVNGGTYIFLAIA